MTYGVNAAKNRNYEDQAIATIHASLDAGIYFLDTGRLLRNGPQRDVGRPRLRYRRDDAFIGVKFGTLRSPSSRVIRNAFDIGRYDRITDPVSFRVLIAVDG